MSKQAGFDGTLKAGGNEVCEVRDATFNLGLGTADASSRCSGGWRERVATLKEWTISGTIIHKSNNQSISTLRNALLTRSTVAVEFLDKDLEGFTGNGFVTTFNQGQPLEDAMTWDFTIEGDGPAVFADGLTS